MAALTRAVDGRAVLVGAGVAAAIALPVALVSQVLVDDGEDNGLVLLFLLGVLAGFGAGGFVAARKVPPAPLTNGALAALLAFAVIQGVSAARRAIVGDPVDVTDILFAALLAYSAGLLGALVANRTTPR